MLNDAYLCRVCGYLSADPPWGLDGRTPSFETCPSCGVEWGYGDVNPEAVRRWRAVWIGSGTRWSDNSVPSDGLSADERQARLESEH